MTAALRRLNRFLDSAFTQQALGQEEDEAEGDDRSEN